MVVWLGPMILTVRDLELALIVFVSVMDQEILVLKEERRPVIVEGIVNNKQD